MIFMKNPAVLIYWISSWFDDYLVNLLLIKEELMCI